VLQPDPGRRLKAVVAQVDPPDQSLNAVSEQHYARCQQARAIGAGGLLEVEDFCRAHRAGRPAAQVKALQGGVAMGGNVKDIRLRFDEAHGQVPVREGMHQDRLDRQTMLGGWYIPDLHFVHCGDQDRPVGAHGQVLQHEVLGKVGGGGDFCELMLLPAS
jgi:hypothetical protein